MSSIDICLSSSFDRRFNAAVFLTMADTVNSQLSSILSLALRVNHFPKTDMILDVMLVKCLRKKV